MVRVLGPDDNRVEADKGLNDSQDDKEGGENLQVLLLGVEVEDAEEDGAAEQAPAHSVEKEDDGEADDRQGEAVQGDLTELKF